MKRRKDNARLGLALIAVGLSFITGAFAASWLWLPDVTDLAAENPRTSAYIQLYVRKTRAKGKKPVVMMRWARLDEISPYLRKAVLIGEDDSFYRHGGIDWEALQKAFEYNRKKGRFARGGSTITEQVARNLYLSPERSPLRKFKELLIAKKLESALTKDRILEIYLNIAEWGRGIYGAQAASQIYFGKAAADLTPEEAAALAAALPSPWRRNPTEGGKQLEYKKEIILARMRKAGFIPPDVPVADLEVPGSDPIPAPEPKKKAPAPLPCDTPASAPVIGAEAARKEEDIRAELPDSCGPQAPGILPR